MVIEVVTFSDLSYRGEEKKVAAVQRGPPSGTADRQEGYASPSLMGYQTLTNRSVWMH